MINYKYPRSFPKAEEIRLHVNGEEVDVLKTNVAYFASASYVGEAKVEITTASKAQNVKISPVRLGLKAEVKANSVTLSLKSNVYLHIEIEGVKLPLFFYGNPQKEYDGNATYYFKSGQIYEIGDLIIKDNESIYIEGGAVVNDWEQKDNRNRKLL